LAQETPDFSTLYELNQLNYHFVGPPLASITAWQRSFMLATYFKKSGSLILAHSSSANRRTSAE